VCCVVIFFFFFLLQWLLQFLFVIIRLNFLFVNAIVAFVSYLLLFVYFSYLELGIKTAGIPFHSDFYIDPFKFVFMYILSVFVFDKCENGTKPVWMYVFMSVFAILVFSRYIPFLSAYNI
jgi:hypothetical protein